MNIDEFKLKLSLEGTFEGQLGTEYETLEPGRITGHIKVHAGLLSSAGLVPLGLYASVAEGAASIGAAVQVWDQGMIVAGISNDTTATAAASSEQIDFIASCKHQAPDLSVWAIDFQDGSGELVATSTVRVAVRPVRS